MAYAQASHPTTLAGHTASDVPDALAPSSFPGCCLHPTIQGLLGTSRFDRSIKRILAIDIFASNERLLPTSLQGEDGDNPPRIQIATEETCITSITHHHLAGSKEKWWHLPLCEKVASGKLHCGNVNEITVASSVACHEDLVQSAGSDLFPREDGNG